MTDHMTEMLCSDCEALVLFEAHDYSKAYLDDAAELAHAAGVAPYPLT